MVAVHALLRAWQRSLCQMLCPACFVPCPNTRFREHQQPSIVRPPLASHHHALVNATLPRMVQKIGYAVRAGGYKSDGTGPHQGGPPEGELPHQGDHVYLNLRPRVCAARLAVASAVTYWRCAWLTFYSIVRALFLSEGDADPGHAAEAQLHPLQTCEHTLSYMTLTAASCACDRRTWRPCTRNRRG